MLLDELVYSTPVPKCSEGKQIGAETFPPVNVMALVDITDYSVKH